MLVQGEPAEKKTDGLLTHLSMSTIVDLVEVVQYHTFDARYHMKNIHGSLWSVTILSNYIMLIYPIFRPHVSYASLQIV